MNKRTFLLRAGLLSVATTMIGCISRIEKTATDQTNGPPYQCGRCGYLTRSKTDISADRCPRCRARKLKRISEAEMAKALDQ